MNHRSYSVDLSHYDHPVAVRPHDYARSWSVCEDYSYSPSPSILEDDDMPDPSVVYPQATSMADKCGYRTGKCFNMRAQKRNGKDHKLCDFHREKANQNQKKLDRKKRLQRFSPYESTSPKQAASPLDTYVLEHPLGSPTRIDDAPQVLGFDEVQFFCNAMTPAQKLAMEEAFHLPAVKEEVDPAADLDILFKSEVMFFVDQL
ncbi:Aste57867_1756 [Aphanomyces stellatus]|uniref:Aste57867_1756 protein n=1 Tax=Aphanomyces stellatus TaxID=120398 RepID=A0A485K8L1_9STRA|nr:hypothetical protein As57867_001754 [Aphanomyces stellatus]VFT78965.1 Aste57867_1756 [Aphanomyces stellatus]